MAQPGAEQLVVRQHERHLCRVACRMRVGEQNAEQVTPARSVGDGAGGIDATVVDCSRGGLGLESAIYFPRGCRIKVRLSTDVELLVRVQRASMTDRKPTYYLGVSFAGSGSEHDRAVAAAVEMAKAASVSGKEAA